VSTRLNAPELRPRQQAVLRALIEQYVATAEPVASAQVVRDRNVSMSAATARSVMGQLTDLGLLSQPHTSAGRIPTDLAFRHYADGILRESLASTADPDDRRLPLARELAKSSGEMDALLRRAVDLLSESTGQLGFFMAARPDNLSRELERVGSRLGEFIAGCTLAEARACLAAALEEDRSRSGRLWPKVLALGALSVAGGPEVSLYLADKVHLLAHPEFAQVERLRALLAAVEEKERMVRLLDKILRAEALAVNIGDELDDPNIRECALVTAPLGDSPALGGLGVLGPVRMPYDKVIPLVRSLSLLVNRYLS
jgi:heat-inducible transcriptional repressor